MQRMVVENQTSVDKPIRKHLREKRNELIWALSMQDYTFADIGAIFNMNRATAFRIIEKKPRDWVPKWIKENK